MSREETIKQQIPSNWKITTQPNGLVILEGNFFKWFLNPPDPKANDLYLEAQLKLSFNTLEKIEKEFKLLDDIRDYKLDKKLSVTDLINLFFA